MPLKVDGRNDLLIFADEASVEKNQILSYEQYLNDEQRATGNAGKARRMLVNKALNQLSRLSAAIGQFIGNRSTIGVRDSSSIDATEASIVEAIAAVAKDNMPLASTTVAGLVKMATDNEVLAAGDKGKAITSYQRMLIKALQAPIDYNTLMTPGYYQVPYGDTVTNGPYNGQTKQSTNILIVFKVNASRIAQLVFPFGPAAHTELAIRTTTDGGVTWTRWSNEKKFLIGTKQSNITKAFSGARFPIDGTLVLSESVIDRSFYHLFWEAGAKISAPGTVSLIMRGSINKTLINEQYTFATAGWGTLYKVSARTYDLDLSGGV